MSVLYTTTVGEACPKRATIRSSDRGIYITPNDRENIKNILKIYARQDIGCIVVIDGCRILGLGDLGASVAKLML
jgi:malic enzyme